MERVSRGEKMESKIHKHLFQEIHFTFQISTKSSCFSGILSGMPTRADGEPQYLLPSLLPFLRASNPRLQYHCVSDFY